MHTIVAPTLGQVRLDLVITADLHTKIVDAAVGGDTAALRQAIADHYDPVRALIRAAKSAS